MLAGFYAEEFLGKDQIFLTVAHLIELLQKQPPQARVVLEGCDCYGLARSVVLSEKSQDSIVVIEREQ